jgi:hypothetical protein
MTAGGFFILPGALPVRSKDPAALVLVHVFAEIVHFTPIREGWAEDLPALFHLGHRGV